MKSGLQGTGSVALGPVLAADSTWASLGGGVLPT